MKRFYRLIVISAIVLVIAIVPGHANDIVFDPTNFGANVEQVLQNIEILARLNEQIRNQLRMLENWGFTQLGQLLASMQHVRGALDEAGPLDVDHRYPILPRAYSERDYEAMRQLERHWLEAQRTALVHAETLQNRIVTEMPATQSRVAEYVQRANAAPGQTAVLQATNETLATLVGQLQTLQALEVSETRIELEEDAHRQAQETFWRQRRTALMKDWPTEINDSKKHQSKIRPLFANHLSN